MLPSISLAVGHVVDHEAGSIPSMRAKPRTSAPVEAGPSDGGAKPRWSRDRAAKQRALMLAAEELFAQGGYETTSTRAIAARAGCAEGLIHKYFHGKAGLLLALVQWRSSQASQDLALPMPQAATFEDEFVQLVGWQVDRIWEAREFLKVLVPQALVDPGMRSILAGIVTSGHGLAIVDRLKHFRECPLSDEELEMIARLVDVLAFNFGFLRPAILGQHKDLAKQMAGTIARVLIRSGKTAAAGQDYLSDESSRLIFS
jgi:AcrR family transcriptional regulator